MHSKAINKWIGLDVLDPTYFTENNTFMMMTWMKLNLEAGGEEMTGANKSTLSDSLIYILPQIQKL